MTSPPALGASAGANGPRRVCIGHRRSRAGLHITTSPSISTSIPPAASNAAPSRWRVVRVSRPPQASPGSLPLCPAAISPSLSVPVPNDDGGTPVDRKQLSRSRRGLGNSHSPQSRCKHICIYRGMRRGRNTTFRQLRRGYTLHTGELSRHNCMTADWLWATKTLFIAWGYLLILVE